MIPTGKFRVNRDLAKVDSPTTTWGRGLQADQMLGERQVSVPPISRTHTGYSADATASSKRFVMYANPLLAAYGARSMAV